MSLGGQDAEWMSGGGGRRKTEGNYGKGEGSRGNRKRPTKGGAMARQAFTKEVLDAERSALITEKQAELDAVFDRHDTLVREIFHMEHFRMMIAFNPQEAKAEDSAVFRDYKAQYDLLEKAAPTEGPSRKTRSAHTERRQFIPQPSISSSAVTPHKSKSKGKLQPDSTLIWDILASAKGKGKSKEGAARQLEFEDETAIGRQDGGDSISVTMSRSKGKSKGLRHERPLSLSDRGPRIVPMNPLDRDDTFLAPSHDTLPQDQSGTSRKRTADSMTNGHSPRKRRRTEPKPSSSTNGLVFPDSMRALPTASTYANGHGHKNRRRRDSLDHPTASITRTPRIMPNRAAAHRSSQVAIPTTPLTSPSTLVNVEGAGPPLPKLNIKRIKLLVRRPPPSFSNPRQKPPPPRFNSSLPAFLSSYITLDDQDFDEKSLEQQAIKDAAVLERADKLCREGRIIPGTDVLFGASANTEMSPTHPQRTSTDAWDDIVATTVIQGRLRSRKPSGRQIAAQIAGKILAYWDGYAMRQDKAKAQEEKRLKALAKATIRAVTSEWKKAVFHIREKERLKLEAEEVKRGHEHLDAILDQSGQILETQQGDLTRGDIPRSRSRSSSVSATSQESALDVEDEEDEDEEDGEDVDDVEGGQRSPKVPGSEDEEEMDMAKSPNRLLGDDRVSISETTPRSKTPSIHGPSDDESHLERSPPSDLGPDHDDSSVLAVDELISPEDASSQSPRSISSVPENRLEDHMTRDSGYLSPQSSVLDLDRPIESSAIGPDTNRDTGSADGVDMTYAIDADVEDRSEQEPLLDARKQNDGVLSVVDVEGQPVSSSPSGLDAMHGLMYPSSNDIEGGNLRSSNSPGVVLEEKQPGNVGSCQGSKSSLIEDANPLRDIHDSAPAELIEVEAEERAEEEAEVEDNTTYFIPEYLKPYAVAPVDWHPDEKLKPPLLLRGILRPYQQSGLEWLASLHTNNLNGILADEMGLGKTIQTIALLAHLACDRGIWGPHLIIVPTSVLLNWEMEFKKFLPGFKILSYHGSTKRRKELRQGWNDRHHFNVCITSYTLASRDAHIFKRKAWYYMVLDEAHMIKNFKSQRWNILLMFRSFRRLLLTGTPLQNNLTELWALLQFLMSGANFANLKEFGEWFSNPLEKAIEMGNALDDETMQRVSKLHTVLRPYLLRRLKRDVEKELPSKFEHLILCPLSKRQRFLYDEFMSRAHTRDALQSGVYQKIANVLMQLRKVCNHPDLFEIRPIVTSFAMERSAIADFEIKELLIRRQLLKTNEEEINLDVLGFRFIDHENTSMITASESHRLDGTFRLPYMFEDPGIPPLRDTRTIAGHQEYMTYQRRANSIARWAHIGYLNRLRCNISPVYSQETVALSQRMYQPILPLSALDTRHNYLDSVQRVNSSVKSFATRAEEMANVIDRFAFVTPAVVARDMPHIALSSFESSIAALDAGFDDILHRASVKLQIAFPDPSLLQYDCGKLQELSRLLREKKAGGHRVLIFTQMTRILDILEIFLNFHGYLYLRLDGATKIEDRQYITERFNVDSRVFCFIASSRSGGVGINLTGADTVVFYDSDFNPQMDRQCEDRAHRIGQIRDVHIYRFVSQHTVEEAMLRKANQKRSLDNLVIQKGEFDWRTLFTDENALTNALGEFEDTEDAHAAAVAAREEIVMEGADEADFGGDVDASISGTNVESTRINAPQTNVDEPDFEDEVHDEEPEDDAEEGGTIVDYMLGFVQRNYELFREWRL